jgi:hypothetical protein
MDPIVFEEHSCEENENTVVYHACAVTLATKSLWKKKILYWKMVP